MTSNNQDVAVFLVNYSIGKSAPVICMLDLLTEHFNVDVYMHNVSYLEANILKKNINLIPIKGDITTLRFNSSKITKQYKHYITIDPNAFALCKVLFPDSRPIYYSLELYFENNFYNLSYPEKVRSLVKEQINTTKGLIIQSPERETLFREEYKLSDSISAFLLPITYLDPSYREKSNYIRDKFNIPDNQKIALHLGGIQEYHSLIEISSAFKNLPDWVFVMHGSHFGTYINDLKNFIAQNRLSNVIISEDYFDYIEDMDIVLKSADIGIAWYKNVSPNFTTAGKSSGKIPAYLRFGLPIVANKYPSTIQAIEDTGCGICVDHFFDIPETIIKIASCYNQYAENAYREYDKVYWFENYRKPLLDFTNSANKSSEVSNMKSSDLNIAEQIKAYMNSSEHERKSYHEKNRNITMLKDRLINANVPVIDAQIEISDFQAWFNTFDELAKHYINHKDFIIEKCLEHYLAFKWLLLSPKDVYIDIAAAGSIWADILYNKGFLSYRLDLTYPEGIKGRNIGADACNTNLPDGFANAMSLQCAFETFQNDADIRFIREAGRVLTQQGRLAILPLYLNETYIIISSPYVDLSEIIIDQGAIRVWRDDQYKEPYDRHYSPEAFTERVYSQLENAGLQGKIIHFTNLDELRIIYPDQHIYCDFMFFCEKIPQWQCSESMKFENNFINPVLNIGNMDIYYVRKSILNSLKSTLPQMQGIFLDVGCGQMPYRKYILTNSQVKKYIGLDFSGGMYADRQKPDITWEEGKIPLEDNSIDCVMATEVLEHCPEPEKVLAEIHRVLKPSGFFFFTVPFLWPLHDVPHDEYRYTPFSLKRLLHNLGFDQINIAALGGWNASLAQMIGLWIRRAPMEENMRNKYENILFPFYQELLERDKNPEQFSESTMFTGLSVTAIKPGILKKSLSDEI